MPIRTDHRAALHAACFRISRRPHKGRYPALDKEPACRASFPPRPAARDRRTPTSSCSAFLGWRTTSWHIATTSILLDAGIDTLSWWEQSGVTPEMMTKDVDAILIGHAHGEHLWDAPYIGEKTGALVVADPIAMRWIRGNGTRRRQEDGDSQGTRRREVPIQRLHGGGSPRPSQHRARTITCRRIARRRPRSALKGGLTPQQQAHDRRLGGMVPTTA